MNGRSYSAVLPCKVANWICPVEEAYGCLDLTSGTLFDSSLCPFGVWLLANGLKPPKRNIPPKL